MGYFFRAIFFTKLVLFFNFFRSFINGMRAEAEGGNGETGGRGRGDEHWKLRNDSREFADA